VFLSVGHNTMSNSLTCYVLWELQFSGLNTIKVQKYIIRTTYKQILVSVQEREAQISQGYQVWQELLVPAPDH
jgi:hypothetical protein